LSIPSFYTISAAAFRVIDMMMMMMMMMIMATVVVEVTTAPAT
jgi:hypothetical protein